MAFKARTTVVTLEAERVMALQQILMDEDETGALEFLRDVIGEKIQCAQDDSHRPEFEGGVRLQESHQRSKGAGHLPEGESG